MPYQLTPEQLAIQEERRRKKALAKEAAASVTTPSVKAEDGPGKILKRNWVQLRERRVEKDSVKVMTWNMLAQTLIQRKLFPSSDCLRKNTRATMLPHEILTYSADIVCLQEVDRLEMLIPPLEAGGYAHTYSCGRGKKHGCMVLHKASLFTKLRERTVFLDEEDLHEDGNDREPAWRRGGTHRTRNIALIVALGRTGNDGKGYVIATSHMFWHPQYPYERARQGAIILRHIKQFQEENGYSHWPVFFAGDFNSQPSEPLYALLTGMPLTPAHEATLTRSHVVHKSLEEPPAAADDEDEAEAAPAETEDYADDEESIPVEKRMSTHSRRAAPADGLLSASELEALYAAYGRTGGVPGRSAYDEVYGEVEGEADNTFGARSEDASLERGKGEPMWTSFTHYWRLTLDYILILDPISTPAKGEVTGVLKTHRKENLEPGLPMVGICASDHISLMVEVEY